MANYFTTQILKDTNRETVIKITGEFDGNTQEANNYRIQANTLYGALDINNLPLKGANTAKPFYGLYVHRLFYDVNFENVGYVQVDWTNPGGNNIAMFVLGRSGEYNQNGGWISIPNLNLGANVTGDIGITTLGAAKNASYTLIFDLKKDGNYYDVNGRFDDPAASNYSPFGVTP